MTNDDERDVWHARTIQFRKVGPRPAADLSIGQPCFACGVPFAVGDYTTLIPLGPGNKEAARAEARLGRPFCAVAVQIHWSCATGEEP